MTAIDNVRTINLDNEIIELNPKLLHFTDATLGKFMENAHINYDYFSSKSTKAETLLKNSELDYDVMYLEKFADAKSQGISDKGADAMSRVNAEVIAAQKKVIDCNSSHRQLKEYLKAFDKAFEMATNRGYMIRKEMDKLGSDIYYKKSDINVDDILDPNS